MPSVLNIPIFLILLAIHQASGVCPRGWFPFERSCYFFSTTHRSWTSASSFCRTNHSELAVIETESENNFISDVINRIKGGLAKRRNLDYDFWIGGTDEVLEGVWMWAPKGTKITYSNWNRGAPEDTNGNEDCLEIVKWDGLVGKWNDDNCSDESHFICEMELPALGGIVG